MDWLKKILNKLLKKLEHHIEKHLEDALKEEPLDNTGKKPEGPDGPESQEENVSEDKQEPADEVPFSELHWSFGGVDGSRRIISSSSRIRDLVISENGMRYSWVSGGCEKDLGAESRTDANCLACVFYKEGKFWRGGKFDWISTSRTSRDFKNIFSGYRGWNSEAFEKSKEVCFVIISTKNNFRTNVIKSDKRGEE